MDCVCNEKKTNKMGETLAKVVVVGADGLEEL